MIICLFTEWCACNFNISFPDRFTLVQRKTWISKWVFLRSVNTFLQYVRWAFSWSQHSMHRAKMLNVSETPPTGNRVFGIKHSIQQSKLALYYNIVFVREMDFCKLISLYHLGLPTLDNIFTCRSRSKMKKHLTYFLTQTVPDRF